MKTDNSYTFYINVTEIEKIMVKQRHQCYYCNSKICRQASSIATKVEPTDSLWDNYPQDVFNHPSNYCLLCCKCFKTTQDFKEHLYVEQLKRNYINNIKNLDETKLSCPYCEKQYKTISKVKQHIKKTHTNNDTPLEAISE